MLCGYVVSLSASRFHQFVFSEISFLAGLLIWFALFSRVFVFGDFQHF